MDVRLPAALSLDTGQLVDVNDVPRGRNCGCICPSCGQGLLARQGEWKAWHFAHEHDSPIPPKNPCIISFDVVARDLAVQLLLSGNISSLHLPELTLDHQRTGLTEKVAPKSEHHALHFEKGGPLQLFTNIKGHRLDIGVGQLDDGISDAIYRPGLAAIGIAIDVATIRSQYFSRNNKTTFTELLVGQISDVTNIRWLCHPRLEAAQDRLKARVQEQLSTKTGSFPGLLSPKDDDRSAGFLGTYTCSACDHRWPGRQLSPRDFECPKCGAGLGQTMFDHRRME
ncbi:hypothetical protein IC617_08460 [Neiella sp. HB171785]|uniref:Competence protein CoiA-like N-terminal domain-containing protein n=1 Tax=Neiella litorisoli TaxID=2771431 RepID=A0A8J6QIX4_9GAMM|nr:hypothetical protein [Neiella litorisoli]MBD1389457.1 hypothetical protein [Neiella litorisoli]